MHNIILFTIFFTFLSTNAPPQAIAQSAGQFSLDSAYSLVLQPRFPEPKEQINITINDHGVNTHGATIEWFIDEVRKEEYQNKRSITFITGKLGTSNTIKARSTLPNQTVLEATVIINPVRIDMLIEADTLTPVFYKGRAIPTSGSLIRVTAITFTGENKSPAEYSYLWRVGGDVQAEGSQFGKNYTTFKSGFKKNVFVSVDVINSEGFTIASESIYVPIAKPELHFYVVNPLRGISETAIDSSFIFIGDEIQIRAEPFFINRKLLSQNPHREWKINNRTVSNPSSDPQEITLRREGVSGSFELEFHIRNLQQLLQGVKRSITIKF